MTRTTSAVMAIVVVVLGGIALATVSLSPVQSADDVKFPVGYRNWFHVNAMLVDKASPQFDVLGGMHSVYVNAAGAAALKKGGPYPDKTVLVDDVREFTVSEGSLRRRCVEGSGSHDEGQKALRSDGRLGLPGLGCG